MQGWFNTKKPVKQGLVPQDYKSTTWEAEAEGWGVQGHPWLYSRLKVSLGYGESISQKRKEGRTDGRKEPIELKVIYHIKNLIYENKLLTQQSRLESWISG